MAKTNIEQWRRDFLAKAKIAEQLQVDRVKRAAEEFFKRLKERTPIGMPSLWKRPPMSDYVPGALRSSYTFSVSRKGRVIRVFNSRPYFQRIEDGWSSQAPVGMLKTTIAEWVTILSTTR